MTWTDLTVSGTQISVVSDTSAWVLDPNAGAVKHWTPSAVATVAYPTSNNEIMDDVWAFSGTDVYLCGRTPSTASILHYNGSSWTSMPLPSGLYGLQRLWGRAPNDLYAIGDALLHYDGVAWTRVDGVGQVLAVWGAPDDLFAGTYTGVQHFDGSRWDPVSLGFGIGVQQVTGVGNSIMFIDNFGDHHQIVRLAPW
jgi:hypothetical protein